VVKALSLLQDGIVFFERRVGMDVIFWKRSGISGTALGRIRGSLLYWIARKRVAKEYGVESRNAVVRNESMNQIRIW
jgi:hypothetical protein